LSVFHARVLVGLQGGDKEFFQAPVRLPGWLSMFTKTFVQVLRGLPPGGPGHGHDPDLNCWLAGIRSLAPRQLSCTGTVISRADAARGHLADCCVGWYDEFAGRGLVGLTEMRL
jgi:hypothetical protein